MQSCSLIEVANNAIYQKTPALEELVLYYLPYKEGNFYSFDYRRTHTSMFWKMFRDLFSGRAKIGSYIKYPRRKQKKTLHFIWKVSHCLRKQSSVNLHTESDLNR